ncbi:MAG: glycosyltransferase family 4 protein [Coriobacteriia bacterium]|nr:glycosyltransferase family 4 protein [Coriobacteriia bacterium]
MFPTESSPHLGIFVRREVDALRLIHPNAEFRVWHIDTPSTKAHYVFSRRKVLVSVSEWRPNIIHCHYGFTPWFAPHGRAPVVCTYHGTDLTVAWKRRISLLMGVRVDHGIIVSESLRPLAPSRKAMSLVACGVDKAFLPKHPREAVRGPGLPGKLRLLFPGDPKRTEKDFPLFEQVIVELQQRGLSVTYSTLDQVAPEVVVDRMNDADVVVMTSRAEGSPVTVREALCCGCRVVTTDVGDVRRWLSQFTGCRVVDSRSPSDLANACVDVFSELGPDSAVARSMLTVDSEAEAIWEIYKRLLSAEA